MQARVLSLILIVVAGQALADDHEKAMSDKPAIAASRSIAFSADVVGINYETREVTLLNDDDEEFTITASDEVRNLAQIQPGDTVRGELTEEVTIQVFDNPEGLEPAAAERITGGRAKEGAMPGGVMVDEVMITAVIEEIDLENNIAKLRGPQGNIREFTPRNPENLRKVEVGDLVVVKITQALGMIAERPTGG